MEVLGWVVLVLVFWNIYQGAKIKGLERATGEQLDAIHKAVIDALPDDDAKGRFVATYAALMYAAMRDRETKR